MYGWFRSSAPLWLAVTLLAQDGAKPKPASPARAEYEKLVAEYDTAVASYAKAMKELAATDEFKQAVTDKNREKIAELNKQVARPDMAGLGKKAMAAAEKYAGKEDAVPFLGFALTKSNDKELAKQAADALLASHTKSPKLVEVVENSLVQPLGKDKANEFYDKVAADNSNSMVQAWSLYWKASSMSRGRDVSDEDKAEAKKLLDKAEQLAEGHELADRIRAPRFAQERLQVGMEVPDIAGVDLDGKAFKLSDYRGKVVVVDFWGDW